jgi:hypothetical protein
MRRIGQPSGAAQLENTASSGTERLPKAAFTMAPGYGLESSAV